MSNEKVSLMDKLMSKVDAIAGPMTAFGQIPFIRAIVNGMVSAVGVTMVGSIFLIIYLLGSDGGLTEHALLPFLKPFAGDLALVNSLSMGIMAVYMVIAMGSEYAEIKGFNKTTGAVGAFFAFLLLNYDAVGKLFVEGVSDSSSLVSAVPINYWGGAGVITAIIAAGISINVISICYKHNIRIKLPDSVPPAIADSFSAIIPYFLITIICWGTRTLVGLNIPDVVGNMLLPVLSAADNIFVYTLSYFLISLLWIVGLHGDNIVNAVTATFTNTWMADNNAAFMAGTAVADLPNVWVPNLNRLFMWVSTCWPILFYMFKSSKKLPHLKPLATICFPPAIFCIIEPMMFGLPIVLNPFLAIPFIFTHTLTGALTYFLTDIGFVGKMYLNLPWATPSPILGFLATGGSMGGVIIVLINFIIGMVIFYPFWKSYEASEIKRLEEEEAATHHAEAIA
ncbi:MAG: PTS sugar transporter subunit IIC [Erysipelotrichaceae bacterium]